MDECLQDADFCITCSSTAGIESLCNGIPTAFYLDFSYNENTENIINKTRDYFKSSNLLYSKKELINLTIKKPNHNWILENFCKIYDINEIFDSVKIFKEKYAYSCNEYANTQKSIQNIPSNFFVKFEYYIVKIFSPRKRKKFLTNRKKFFTDSKNVIVYLYWKFIGSTFNS